MTDGRSDDSNPIWSPDGRALYFVSSRGGARDLWIQRLEPDGELTGPAEPMTAGLGLRSASLSRDGSRLAYSKGRRVRNVWRVPILVNGIASWEDAEPITADEAYVEYVDVSPDGSRVAFSSDRSGNSEIWVLSLNGEGLQQLTSHPSPDWDPRWSPDGKRIAFHSHRSGNRDIWIQSVDGGPAESVTFAPSQDFTPSWSPDGRKLLYSADNGVETDIWVVDLETGERERLIENPGSRDYWAQWSPDGRQLVFNSVGTDNVFEVWTAAIGGRDAKRLLAGPGTYPRWSPDGKLIYFIRHDDIWVTTAEGADERRLTDFRNQRGSMDNHSLATDGRYFYFSWGEDLGDIWVMDILQME